MLAIDAHYRKTFADLGLNSFNSIVAFFGAARPPRKTTVIVKPQVLEPPGQPALPVFFKIYEHSPAAWAFFGRASKARCEFENYEVFNRLGIPCAARIACGEERDAIGRLRRAFIITRAIPDALNAVEFFKERLPSRSTPAQRAIRAGLLRQLAQMTATIHSAGFFHHDLVWRNILVAPQSSGEPALWWIDCPRGQFDRWSPWRERRRLKDLASLDKSASKHCSRGERLAFIKHYLGKPRLDAEARKLIRRTLNYRRQRWPEDWNED